MSQWPNPLSKKSTPERISFAGRVPLGSLGSIGHGAQPDCDGLPESAGVEPQGASPTPIVARVLLNLGKTRVAV